MILHASGLGDSRRHDWTLCCMRGLEQSLQSVVEFFGRLFCIFDDPGYKGVFSGVSYQKNPFEATIECL